LASRLLTFVRPRVFSLALPWVALACSDGSGTVLSTKADPGLVLGECAGERTDCASVVEVRAYEAGPTVECTMLDRGEGSMIWALAGDGIECPAPPCSLGGRRVEATPSGTLEVMAEISGVNGQGAGWWFATFGADGTPMGAAVRNFTTETRLSEPKLLLPSGFDAAGDAFVVERAGDIDITGIFTAQILRFDAAHRDPELVVSLEDVIDVTTAIADDGSLAASITWPGNAYLDDSWGPVAAPARFDVARFDAAGRLLWNQSKFGRDVALNYVSIAGFDAVGNLSVLLIRDDRSQAMPPQLRDGGFLALTLYRVVRFDGDGNVLGVYDLPLTLVAGAIAAPDGSVYLVRNPLSVDADNYYVIEPPGLFVPDRGPGCARLRALARADRSRAGVLQRFVALSGRRNVLV
jgi:hypothetical protein